MRKKRAVRILFCILIYLMSFTGIYAIIDDEISTDIVGNVRVEPYVPEGNAIVTITATIKIKLLREEALIKNPAVHLIFKKDLEYLLLENMAITGANVIGNDRIKFDKNPTLTFTISGKLNADWSKNNLILKIGEVYNSVGNGNKKDKLGDVLIDLKENIKIISPLKIHVEDMDFGTIIAGQSVETEGHSRRPAVIEVEGTKNENVIITIPNSLEIFNENKDKLIVYLRFRENKAQKICKNINQMIGKELTGKTEKIKIDGSLATKKDDSGVYKGTFTVRAEYVD